MISINTITDTKNILTISVFGNFSELSLININTPAILYIINPIKYAINTINANSLFLNIGNVDINNNADISDVIDIAGKKALGPI